MKYRTPAALEMAIKAAAKASPLDTNLAISSFYYHRLLCRVFNEKETKFVLKGGLSILARTVDARATRDIDLLAQEVNLNSAIEELKRLALTDLGDFVNFDFNKIEPIKSEDEYRDGVKVWFTPMLGIKSLQPISIDLVVDEIDCLAPEILTPADRLDIDGLFVCDYRVFRAESALADKLLAMLEIYNNKPSSRVKDLIDVVVYAKTCEIDGNVLAKSVTKEAAVRKVALREDLVIPETWFDNYEATYANMAKQARVERIAPNLHSAQQLARKLYAPALGNTPSSLTWSPDNLQWS